ncbi:MAG: hypothetical protein HYY90_04290 [Candidatus Omnitrophica bacterium]|nr:hypothetical protein [Candidatus Omnitrophota bacterium]MBI3021667.1 hypothetical protein [Candidatus Omnitrophota bacterium]MBI3083564.1 hypothetical protein [Candidatus Omnitrophota bacterium]
MDIQELWDKARKQTEVLRMQLQDLSTFQATVVPYIFLAESAVNPGDSIVRKGQVLIERPSIVLPGFSPQFEGFEFESDLHVSDNTVATFLLVRGIQFPSLKYRHQVSSLDVFEDSLQKAIEHYTKQLTLAEDIKTGLVVGPEDTWQLSLLLLVGALVVRSAEGDLRRILEEWRKRQKG